MSVGTWDQPDFESQSGTAYKTNIDNCLAVAGRIGSMYAPHEQATPNMTVRVDAGYLFSGVTLTEVAAQSTGAITAPSSDPRIDRVVVDQSTGTVSVVTGTESGAPSPPAIPSGKWPVCQVYLTTSTTEITNQLLTDERAFGLGSGGSGGGGDLQVFNSSGTWTKPGGITFVMFKCIGGGGGGGKAGPSAGGGGGGGGAAFVRLLLATSVGSSVSVTVGSGGNGGSYVTGKGGDGFDTAFGTHGTAPGGDGGYGASHATYPGYGGAGGYLTDVGGAPMIYARDGRDGEDKNGAAGGTGGDSGMQIGRGGAAGIGGDLYGGGGGGGSTSGNGGSGASGVCLVWWW